MADDAKVSGGRSLTWVWMIVAVVAMGGFLVWLSAASEPSAVAVVEEDGGEEDEAAGGEAGVVEVVKDTLAANKARYEGQRVRVAQVEATGALGDRVFWGELGDRANQVPILVRLDSAAAASFQVQSGSLYTLTGEVIRMSDSVATAWGEQGEFAGEGEQMQAAFADYYIQVSRIRPSRSQNSGSSSDGEGASDADGG